ncbi:hypothetical protein LCGC14_3153930, partial [marine sediment metagenome]
MADRTQFSARETLGEENVRLREQLRKCHERKLTLADESLTAFALLQGKRDALREQLREAEEVV